MKLSCAIVKDVLPLYADGVVSDETREAIEEHLCNCPGCLSEYEAIEQNEVSEKITANSRAVVDRGTKRMRKAQSVLTLLFALIFAVPVLICLTVALASNTGLTWVLITAAGLLVFESVVAVPIVVKRWRLFHTTAAGLVSLFILLFLCAVTSGSVWFFTAVFGVLLGVGIVWFPVLENVQPLKRILYKNKAFWYLAVNSVLFILLMLVRLITVKSYEEISAAVSIVVPFIALAWLLFLILRVWGARRSFRIAASVAVFGCFLYSFGFLVKLLLGLSPAISTLFDVRGIDGAFRLFAFAVCLLISAVLTVSGILRLKK